MGGRARRVWWWSQQQQRPWCRRQKGVGLLAAGLGESRAAAESSAALGESSNTRGAERDGLQTHGKGSNRVPVSKNKHRRWPATNNDNTLGEIQALRHEQEGQLTGHGCWLNFAFAAAPSRHSLACHSAGGQQASRQAMCCDLIYMYTYKQTHRDVKGPPPLLS